MNTSKHLPVLGTIAVLTSACGSTEPTQQLVDARSAMNEARASEASELAPDKVLTANQALDRAEAAHEEDPGSDKEVHLAYLATRKAQIASAHGEIAAAKQTEAQAEDKYQERLKRVAQTSASQLDATRAELESVEQKRAQAEKRAAAAALASLERVATVKAESRGTVITLPGAVLFPSGGSTLPPRARVALDQVVDALNQQPLERKILIEGHTDSRGSDASNQELSLARAQAVRSFLVEAGLEADRVEAVGRGESEPIADNDTAAGRATNRRVNFVLSDSGSASAATSSPASEQPQGTPAETAPR